MKTANLRNSLWTAGVLLLLSSCLDCTTVVHASRSLPGNTWGREDTLCFPLDSLEHGRTYQLTVEGRFLQTFPYRQLHLQLADGTPIIIYVTDDQKAHDNVFLHSVSSQPVPFTGDSTSTTLQLVPNMQREALPGISDIGIRIRR